MKLAIATLAIALSSPAVADEVDVATERMMAAVSAVENSEKTSTPSLLDATELCESLLHRKGTLAATERGWTLWHQFDTANAFTKGGMLMMHVLGGDDFPESCGVIAVPSDSYDLIKLSFDKKYGPVVTPNDDSYSDQPFPTVALSNARYSYRLRSAENPKSALAITVRHKE